MIETRRYNPPLHAMALFTAAVTFPLIFMGGLVTSNHAGMSVPDWPNSYGYNMFLFPPRLWHGGILYEHTHRLMASFVGFCSIALTIVAWLTEERRWVRWLATAVLGMVIFQGVLGGLRVVLVKLDLAIVHACVAQAFFCLAALVAGVTSRWWIEAPDLSAAPRRVVWMAIACAVIVYSQLVVGAVMRHEQAGLAIPDVPLAYGKLLPPMNSAELAADNQQLLRIIDSGTNPRDGDLPQHVSMFQVWINFAHRCGALLVTAAILALATEVLRNRRSYPAQIKRAVYLLLILLTAQLTLGILTILLRKPADVASLHVAVGALVLVTSFILSVRGLRLYSSAMRGHPKIQAAPPSASPFAEDRGARMTTDTFSDTFAHPADLEAILELPADAALPSTPSRLADFYEITKPRMNFLVVATTLFGFRMASVGALHWPLLLSTALGTLLTASSAGVLNQLIERDFDRLMPRTRNRPLPTGRISATEALVFGVLLGVCGIAYLALLVNPLTATLALLTLSLYLALYTPAKRLTTLNTVIGAVPGAIPPMMGVAAAQNALPPIAVALFAIMFLWQMPHFLAIAILYRKDYTAGGFKMLPCADENRTFTNRQIVLYAMALIPASLVPTLLGFAGTAYAVIAIVLGLVFLGFCIVCAVSDVADQRRNARKLFFASIIYVPLLLLAMTLNRM